MVFFREMRSESLIVLNAIGSRLACAKKKNISPLQDVATVATTNDTENAAVERKSSVLDVCWFKLFELSKCSNLSSNLDLFTNIQ